MTGLTRMFGLAVLGMAMATRSVYAADIDPSAVDFKTPADIKWVRNAAGTNESAVLTRQFLNREIEAADQGVIALIGRRLLAQAGKT